MNRLRHSFILTLTCPDEPGIVHRVSGFIADNHGNIVDSGQYSDPQTGSFCMRVAFEIDASGPDHSILSRQFDEVALRHKMDWQLHDASQPARVLIMVSKFDHCMLDLLYRVRMGELNVAVPFIISNHQQAESLAKSHKIPFLHLPVTRVTKEQQEEKLLRLIEKEHIDFVVLARYMQIMTEQFCAAMKGRLINIHHSFLPGFKGAKPYHQAHERGVKLIGATAHYATSDLDEGPIIEQDVTRVTHAQTPAQLVALGREIETRVLSRAVRYQSEYRVILNGNKTVVFS